MPPARRTAPARLFGELGQHLARLGGPASRRGDDAESGGGESRALGERDRLPEGSRRLVVLAELEVGETEETVILLRGGIHRERPAKVLQRPLRLAGVIVQPSHAAPDRDRCRIELDGQPPLGNAPSRVSHRDQEPRMPLPGNGVAGIELERAAERRGRRAAQSQS